MRNLTLIALTFITLSSCVVVRPGEVGVRTTFGTLGEPKTNGVMVINPFTTKVLKLNTQTFNKELAINLPSKEGLTIRADISILYRIKPEMTNTIITTIGFDYDQIITSVFRSASANITSQHFAKDMHSGKRDSIEIDIAESMNNILGEKGFIIEAVLLKSISLPDRLSRAIEEKLEAEQSAQRMEFVLQREKQEAERKRIEAEGTRNAQLIISEGLTDKILQLRQIEMMGELQKSNNAKVIISGGQYPSLMLTE